MGNEVKEEKREPRGILHCAAGGGGADGGDWRLDTACVQSSATSFRSSFRSLQLQLQPLWPLFDPLLPI